MDTSQLSPSQWGLIFLLLSLDRIDPLVGPMGLGLAERGRFREALRKAIVDNRREYAADRSKIPDLAGRVFKVTAEELGEDAAEALHAWATTVFAQVHADQPQWSAWKILIDETSFLDRAKKEGLVTEAAFEAASDELSRRMDRKGLRDAIAEARSAPTSAWDREMYARHSLDESDDLSDPFEKAAFVVELYRFQDAWEPLWAHFSAAERAALHRRAQAALDEMHVWMPGPLVAPADLRKKV